jgi:putative transposase
VGGIGHMRQLTLKKTNWNHRFSHGGTLRNKRAGRKERPISSRDPIHLVFKANREKIPGGLRSPRRYRLIHGLQEKYAKRFYIKIDSLSVQGDHLHLIIRTSRRSGLQNFLRVFSGQVSQQLANLGLTSFSSVTDTTTKALDRRGHLGGSCGKLWKYRPFTRVVKSYRAYRVVQNYVRLNELEAQGKIPYRHDRLRGVATNEWEMFKG